MRAVVEAAERRSEERKANDARHGLLAGGGLGAIQSKVQSIYKDKTGGAAARFLLETLTYCIFVAFFFSGLLTARHDEQEYYMKQHIAEALLDLTGAPTEMIYLGDDHFEALEGIHLYGNTISDEGAAMLVSAIDGCRDMARCSPRLPSRCSVVARRIASSRLASAASCAVCICSVMAW